MNVYTIVTMAHDNTEWEYKQWCEEYELNADTIALLDKRGFKSYKTLANMPEDMFKRIFKDLIAGQQVLLKDPHTSQLVQNRFVRIGSYE